jgi:hypothetical protein
MQESQGELRINSTTADDGSTSAGIMQCDGSPSAFGESDVSQATVTGMVLAGTKHLAGNLATQGGNVFEAFRAYNSGSVDSENLNNGIKANPNYVNDLANRLHGWKN